MRPKAPGSQFWQKTLLTRGVLGSRPCGPIRDRGAGFQQGRHEQLGPRQTYTVVSSFDFAAVEVAAVEGLDDGLGLLIGGHLDEAEAARAAGVAVADDVDVRDYGTRVSAIALLVNTTWSRSG